MMIYHPNLRKKVKVENMEVVHHTVSKGGVEVRIKCVEFDVIGENSGWRDWMTFEDFIKHNRGVPVE